MIVQNLKNGPLRFTHKMQEGEKLTPVNGFRRAALPIAEVLPIRLWTGFAELGIAQNREHFGNHRWIQDLRYISDEAIDDAIIVVLDKLDEWLEQDKIKDCILLLSLVDPEEVHIELSLALLAGTLPAQDKMLDARRDFCQRLETRLRREMPDEVESMLRGLRP